jgi:pre-mRNA-splicing factor 38B
MSRSAESRKLLREMHQQRKAFQHQQAHIYAQHGGYSYGIPPPPPPPPIAGDYEVIHSEIERTEKNTVVPMNGSAGASFNINTMLFQNIMDSDYYKALNNKLSEFQEVIQEIKLRVSHVEPWQAGTSRSPSSAFCLLVKLLTMHLTYKQMRQLLVARGFPYVRALGFLYLRYTCQPTHLYKWYEPFLEDPEAFQPTHNTSGAITNTMPIGTYLRRLLEDLQYYGTPLPRIPTALERKIRVLLLLLEEKLRRKDINQRARDSSDEAFRAGSKIQAVFADADNEPAWYPATMGARDESDPDRDRYWIMFDGYDFEVSVDIGDLGLQQLYGSSPEAMGQMSSADGDGARKRSRPTEPSPFTWGGNADAEDLMAQVLAASRSASEAIGKQYSKRVGSVKDSLSLKLDTHTSRVRDKDDT